MILPISNLRLEAERIALGGVVVLPAIRSQKRPAVPWKAFQNNKFENVELFEKFDAICVVGGPISGNLEILDFDYQAEAFDDFCEEVVKRGGDDVLLRCLIETSQSGGKHLAYKHLDIPIKNSKLAAKTFEAPSNESANGTLKEASNEIIYRGKTLRFDANGRTRATTIETRGEGGICLIAPSPGYEVAQGDWANLPILTREERRILFESAFACDEERREKIENFTRRLFLQRRGKSR